MKNRWVGVALVWVGVLAAQGQVAGQTGTKADSSAALRNDKQKRPMTFADLMAMKRVSDPQISPSGKWVMFSVTDVSLEKNTKVNHLWVVALDPTHDDKTVMNGAPGTGERQITSNTGETFGRFSPDGKFVSYTGAPTKDDPVSRITIATWDEATGAVGMGRALKAVSGDADGAIWSPDSKHFLFTIDVYPECSDKASWPDEDACDKAKDDAAAASPVKAQVWDALLYRHWDHYMGVKRSHIIEADFSLDGANPRDLTPASVVGDAETPTFSLGGPLGYAWAPDSKEIAYVTNLDKVPAASTNNDVFTLRLDEAGAKAVKVSTSPGSDDGPAYSPDGKWLAFRSQARNGFESDRFRLMLFDRGKKTIKEVMPKFDGWVDEFTWEPESKRIYFASGDQGEEPVFSFGLGDDSLFRVRLAPSEDGGEFGDIRVSPSGKTLVATRVRVDDPGRIMAVSLPQLYDRGQSVIDNSSGHSSHIGSDLPSLTNSDAETSESHGLSQSNDTLLSQLSVAPLEPFWFMGAEGTKVEGFMLKPPGFDPANKYPVKFLMHGGPQTAWGDAWSFRWNWELMAANGYVVVGINRRGSTGYGQKFVDEVSGDWGGRAYVDLMKGLDYAEAKYPFMDKTRECALGASYGGFMADWVLTHTNRFKCIVTHDGLYDPESAYGDTEEMWFNEWEFRRAEDFPKGWDGFGGGGKGVEIGKTAEGRPAMPWRYASLTAAEDPFRKWSPMLSIQNAKTPTLVIHSQKDYRLDVSQGIALFTALQRLGVPSKMLYFPDEGHWVLKPQNSQMWNEVVGDWCDRWTKTGKYAELGEAGR